MNRVSLACIRIIFFTTVLILVPPAQSELVHADGNVTLVAGSQYYPVAYASDGNTASRWVTDAVGGYPSDYFEYGPIPIIILDLGSDVSMDIVAFFGYGTDGPHNNCASAFSLRFATETEGTGGFGTSISYNPTINPENLSQTTQQNFAFGTIITARYIEVTITDNFYEATDPYGGGDRVGFSEIQFNEIPPNKAWAPEPATGADNVAPDIILKWKTAHILDPLNPSQLIPNPDVDKHIVYVSNGITSEPAYVGEVDAGDPVQADAQFGPLNLEANKVYYWRIDEYLNDSQTITGDVWFFTTKEQLQQCPQTDLSGDCFVGIDDIIIFAGEWMTDTGSIADFTGGGVETDDFSVLASEWLAKGPAIHITEFMASNYTTLLDEDGMSSDWIEIYNPLEQSISLAGWYLTDNSNDLKKWQFPDVQIDAGDYLIVFASGRNRAIADSELHTNFVLDIKGEYLALVRSDGITIEHEYTDVPIQFEDVSYGLAVGIGEIAPGEHYFVSPTPDAVNSIPYPNVGPEVSNVQHTPLRPTEDDDVVVTAVITQKLRPISSVTLYYRVMYNSEIAVQMYDDGAHSDGLADDNIYGCTITAGVASPGQMLRYYIKTMDIDAGENREPLALDLIGDNQSPGYFGTVVADPSVTSNLQIIEWFTQDEYNSHTRTGARASVFFNNEFYDNMFVRQRGQATNAYSQKFDFNKGYDLYVNDKLRRVEEININAQGADPAYVRQSLAFENHTNAENYSCESFMMLMQLNGSFDRVGVFIEQVDEDFLSRHGLEPEGALYKFVQRVDLNPAFSDLNTGVEKKTRKWEDFSDLQAVVDGLNVPTQLERKQFVFDNLNLPRIMDFLAARCVMEDTDDVRKNFYFYRDTNGNGEWCLFPWDKDFTFGILGDGGTYAPHPFFGDYEHLKLNANQWNVLYDVLFDLSETQQMYLRRLRSVMDAQLQPSDTPAEELKFEARVAELLAPVLEHIYISSSYTDALYNFFPSRRYDLYTTYGPDGVEPLIPESQEGGSKFTITDTLISGTPGVIECSYFIPSDDSLGTSWTEIEFSDSWDTGYTGVGYERSPDDAINYTDLIETDINALMADRTSVYLRIPFTVTDPAAVDAMILRMKYDDGFVAYINGVEATRRYFIGDPAWDSDSDSGRGDSECVVFEDIMISATNLQTGLNILAIHGLNSSSGSSDLLVLPELLAGETTIIDPVALDINFGQIEFNPASYNQDEEYIELINYADTAIDISGWHLTGGVTFDLQPGTVIPAGGSLYVSPNVNAFRARTVSPKGGESRFVQGNYKGHLSSWGEIINLVDANYALIRTTTYLPAPTNQQRYLRITEIMYHPAEGGSYNEEEYEFIEIKNVGTKSVELDGAKLTNGVLYEFTDGDNLNLAAGEYILVVKNQAAFASRYDTTGLNFAPGVYEGYLDNSGEQINFEDYTNSTILDFDYDDNWYDITDGEGFSLTIKDADNPDLDSWDSKSAWRPSLYSGGTPGEDDTGDIPAIGSVVINEILAHSDTELYDWIELYNTTGVDINIGGWFLSDNNNDEPNRMKYEIAVGTIIEADDYLVFYENLHFGNPDAEGCNIPFQLSENGETVYLQSGQDGVLTGYYEEEKFGASEADIAFGRYQKSTGTFNFVAMSSNTPGSANAYPKVGPIVISEIMYHPQTNADAEYVELMNISDSSVTLYNDVTDEPWRFVDDADSPELEYYFPSDTPVTMVPDEKILLIKNATAFELEFGTGSLDGITYYEWLIGSLSNGGEKPELQIPGDVDELMTRYYIRVDRVSYDDVYPWPTEADGSGQSLTKKVDSLDLYGNDVINWQSAAPGPGE